jgi:phosphohistidine phosphatase
VSRLYLLRHGIAVPHGTRNVSEDDRPLTADGEAEVELVARALKRLRVDPERVVTSPLPRAQRTAEIVVARLGRPDALAIDEVLRPGSPAGAIRAWLVAQPDADLMLVGHNPNLTELLLVLIGLPEDSPAIELKKAGAACLERGEGGTELRWLTTPKWARRLLA